MKRLLIVVDYQVDFVDGSLGFPGAELLEEPIAQKIQDYHEAGDIVAFTFDTHRKNYLKTQEGKNLPIEHCIEGTRGHELYGKVADAQEEIDVVFEKDQNTFGSSSLFKWLSVAQDTADRIGRLPFTSIELVGLLSNICVLSNVVIAKTACPEVPIIVDSRCTASNDPDLNEAALAVMRGLHIQIL